MFLTLDNIRGGDELTLFLKGKSNRGFRGFLIQALDIDGKPVGNFTFSERSKIEYQGINCCKNYKRKSYCFFNQSWSCKCTHR